MSMALDIISGTIKKSINENDEDYTACIVGQRGGGKSLTANELARRLDPTFEKACRVVFTIEEYMDTVDRMKKGQVVIFDEAGVNMGAREWMHVQNKVFNYTKQLDRFNNLGVIYTVPDLSFIDKQLRRMLDAVIICRKSGINRVNNVNAVQYRLVHTDPLGGEIRYNPFIWYDNGAEYNLEPMYVPLPPEDLMNEYKRKSIEFKRERMASLRDEAKGIDGCVDKTAMRILSQKADISNKLITSLKEQFTWKQISDMCGYNERQIRRLMAE